MKFLGFISLLRAIFPCFALALCAAMPMLSFAAEGEAEVLWWLVGDPSDMASLGDVAITTFHEGVKTAAEMGVTDARVRIVGTDAYLDMPYADPDGAYPQPAISVPMSFYAIVDEMYRSPEYSFAIELGNYDYQSGTWTMIATSEAASYTDLATDHSIGTWAEITSTMARVWQPTSYTVPEPSGGLLLLIGGGLLALRRRRKGCI